MMSHENGDTYDVSIKINIEFAAQPTTVILLGYRLYIIRCTRRYVYKTDKLMKKTMLVHLNFNMYSSFTFRSTRKQQ